MKNKKGEASLYSRKKRRSSRVMRKKQIKIACSCYSGSVERCGDSCGWAKISEDGFAVAVSDGMGKGEGAARDSSRVVNSVVSMLKAGMDPEMALQILNLLMSQGNHKERFPTMDLAVLDPGKQELFIYKIGAAPTVILRAPRCRPGPEGCTPPGRIEILTAPAMPMGVTEFTQITTVSSLVSAGDRIIMMTDGVFDSMRGDTELKWLGRLLARIKSRSLQTVCDLIIRGAALNYGDREKDDMTIVILQL